ncbi:MAG: radical SAM protein [Candidatus Saelkia tenebricola]|nr:radical SAM protein [Candidatus Saelkia tenebricola]
MLKSLSLRRMPRWFRTLNYPSYIIFFVTGKCNANCKMCFYIEEMKKNSGSKNELTVEEYDNISKNIKLINILGISGGEPFMREDLSEIIKVVYKNAPPLVVDLPTNGYFTAGILKQTEDILKNCPDMIVDLQLSIDGPEAVHDEIRGLENSFQRLKETYDGLIILKNRYRNLRVKACVVYSHYNQNYIKELFNILDQDFKDLDRVVFSVTHGSVSNKEAFDFNWEEYFKFCDEIENTTVVDNIKEFHSLFTIALRITKNDFLKKVLKNRNMYKQCKAGKRVVVVNEVGDVFPCEPLWHSVGNLRENGYDINKILKSDSMKKFSKNIVKEKCNCHWGLPLSNNLIYRPEYYLRIMFEMAKIIARSRKCLSS